MDRFPCDAPPSAEGGSSTHLSPERREADLERLSNELFDVLVVGGGITGAGAALDAASRGLRVGLVEAGDWGCGTSSRSSKMIHGGLRYLEMLDFRLVREALSERTKLHRTIAPHLVAPVEFVLPLNHRLWQRAYLAAGLTLYDLLAARGSLPRHRHLSRKGLRRTAPGLNAEAFIGGLAFHDAGEDDARMVLAVVRTAAGLGVAMATGARAGTSRWVDGCRVVDTTLDDGRTLYIRARHVLYATGASGDQLGLSTDLQVRPSKGVHIVVPRHRIASRTGIIGRTRRGLLFVIPWLDHWLIGDTDTDWPYDRATPVASGADMDGLLEAVNELLDQPLGRMDVVGYFSGIRPLIQGAAESSIVKLSREHLVADAGPGCSVIAGGKYTTYRVMAADAIDHIVARSRLPSVPSRTGDLPLLGAFSGSLADAANRLARDVGVPLAVAHHLVSRYGSGAAEVVLASGAPGKVELLGTGPYLEAEARYAFTHEGARNIADVLERRTRLKSIDRVGCVPVAQQVARIGASVLGWSEVERRRQTTSFLNVLAAEDAALAQSDDSRAWAAYNEIVHARQM